MPRGCSLPLDDLNQGSVNEIEAVEITCGPGHRVGVSSLLVSDSAPNQIDVDFGSSRCGARMQVCPWRLVHVSSRVQGPAPPARTGAGKQSVAPVPGWFLLARTLSKQACIR